MSERDNLPRAPGRRGYEAWYVTVTHSRSGVGYWIRSSVLVPARGSHEAGVWFSRVDPAEPSRTFGVNLFEKRPGGFEEIPAGTAGSGA